jgi:hypothetical protein
MKVGSQLTVFEGIVENLSSELDRTLVVALIDEYRAVKRNHFLGDPERTMIRAGKFCETVFQILEYIVTGHVNDNASINDIMKELEQKPKDQFQDSIRILIPWAAKTVYSIRSKRGAAHRRSDISPSDMDSSFIASTCDWIISEFIRLYYTADQEEIVNMINAVNEREIAIVERIDGDLVILKSGLPIYMEILVILYKTYPNRLKYEDLKRWVKRCKPSAFSNALRKCTDERLVHRNDDGYLLTAKGTRYVELEISRSA